MTTNEDTSAGNAAAWAQLVLTILDEGRRTATYKLAVLLALIDCCAMSADADGRAPAQIPVRDLAVRVLELYWPQVRPYARRDRAPLLKQSSQPRAITVDAVRALRDQAEAVGARSPAAAERALPTAHDDTVTLIELNLVQMPLGKLQRPQGYAANGASDYPRFLYDDAPFHEGVTARQLRQQPLAVLLKPNVGDWLVSLGGLLRPLVEMHWTRAVASFSNEELPEDHLRQFLFGSERISLQSLGPGLREAQAGQCFYCLRPLPVGDVEIDHFVPWSRLPNDALGNLVLADRRCNNDKREPLRGPRPPGAMVRPPRGHPDAGRRGRRPAAATDPLTAGGARPLRAPPGGNSPVEGARRLHRPRPTAPARCPAHVGGEVTEFRKLVRDKIPDLIRAEGRTPVVEVLTSSERQRALLEKLTEEAAEALAASDEKLPEELADVVEVVRTLAQGLGLSLDEVTTLADHKRDRRGGFDQGLFLVQA